MPELPDVETVRRRVAGALVGGEVIVARSDDRRVLRPGSPRAFGRALVGRRVSGVDRRGKWLRLRLDDGGRLFSHLGMTGWWVVRAPDSPRERFERARIDVARGGREASVRYVDPRRFGRLVAARDDIDAWRELGPDPLHDGLDARDLAPVLHERRRAIKEVIMDQSVLAGVGNILATEALWRARIDPRSPSVALAPRDVASVVRALRAEIDKELRARESSDDDWVAGAAEGGTAQAPNDDFAVYGRAGEACRRCGATLARVVLGGRSTTFCRSCQRMLRRRVE